MISYLSLIFMLVVLTGGITSALLLSSLTNTGKVIVLTVYLVLLILVICDFIVTTIKEQLVKQRKEVLETFAKSLDYTRDNIEVLKELNETVTQVFNISQETKNIAERIDVIVEKQYVETINVLSEIRKG